MISVIYVIIFLEIKHGVNIIYWRMKNMRQIFQQQIFEDEEEGVQQDNEQKLTPWSNIHSNKIIHPLNFQEKQPNKKKQKGSISHRYGLSHNYNNKSNLICQQSYDRYIENKQKHRTIQSYLQNYYDHAFLKRQIQLLRSIPSSSNVLLHKSKIKRELTQTLGLMDSICDSKKEEKERDLTEVMLPKIENPESLGKSIEKPLQSFTRNQRNYPIIQTRSKLKKNRLAKLKPLSRQESIINDRNKIKAEGYTIKKQLNDEYYKQSILIKSRIKVNSFQQTLQKGTQSKKSVKQFKKIDKIESSLIMKKRDKSLDVQIRQMSVEGIPTTKIT